MPPKYLYRALGISKEEIMLAGALKSVGVPFEQQYKIGGYTVDFKIPPNIIVEVEGIWHENSLRDAIRTKYLKSRGYDVYRIPTYYIREDAKSVAKLIKYLYEKSTTARNLALTKQNRLKSSFS